MTAVRRHYGLAEGQAMSGEARMLCLYLLKCQSGAKNSEIGTLLGGMRAAAVAKSYQRFLRKLADNPDTAKTIKALEQEMSRVRG